MLEIVHVAVGVICRESVKGKEIFLTQRKATSHQGGKWEFPGGKVEATENVAQALHRELKEEVAIELLACQPLIKITHDYGDKKVLLDVHLIEQYLGEPQAQEEQQQQGWFTLSMLDKLTFPEANKAIIEKLHSISFC